MINICNNKLFVLIQIFLVQPLMLYAYQMLHYFHTVFDKHVKSFVIHLVHVEEVNHVQHN